MALDSKIIQKYKGKTIPKLIKTAEIHFNRFIRLRDSEDGYGWCISCGKSLKVPAKTSHAGHYKEANKYKALKFHEDNVHLQCLKCNFYESANLLEYHKNLIKKIGADKVIELDMLAALSKRTAFKWDRFELIEIIEKYK